MQDLIFYILLAASFTGWFTFVFFALWYWLRERRERTRIRQTKADIADIMLLFQTMRDVVMQQKQLANDFNEELERKVGGVKLVLSSAIEKNERLYEKQRELEQALEDTRAELLSVQRQLTYLPPAAESAAPPRRPQPPERPAPQRTSREILQPAPANEPPFMALPGEESPTAPEPAVVEELPPALHGIVAGAEATLWEQVDMAALSDSTILGEDDEDDEILEVSPEDGAAAREAFRALLDMSATDETGEAATPSSGTNGNVALQQRIVQYADAGMSVGDISRELGIGKGEVRLMLSLAKPGQP